MACMRCVLPNPTPPYRNSGLNVTAVPSATRRAAACANSFGFPTIKLSKVNLGSNGAPGITSDRFIVDLETLSSFFELDFFVRWSVFTLKATRVIPLSRLLSLKRIISPKF